MRAVSSIDMTRGRPAGLLIRFAIPMLLGNLLQQMYNIADSVIVGNFVGTQALAAVGIANYPIRVLLALFIGIGTGATIRISQYAGADDLDGIRRVIRTANALMLFAALPLTVIGLLVAKPVLQLMNTPADTLADASAYLSVVLLGTLSSLGYNLNAGILRGLGDSRSALLFLLVATVVNIVLDILFVAGFGWGTVGAAAATAIAMTVSWVYSIAFLHKRYPHYAAALLPPRPDGPTLRDIVRLGLPIGINDALFSLGHLMLSSLVNTHGSAFAAGYSVGNKVDAFSFMPLNSIAAATTTYVGQNVGAGRSERIGLGARASLVMAVGWNLFSAAVMLLVGRWLIGLFDSNPAVVEYGYGYIVRREPLMWIYGIMCVLNAVMQGAGEVRVPMIANIVLFWGVRLPAAHILSALLPPIDLLYAYPISWLAGLIISGSYYATGRWKKKIADFAAQESPKAPT